MKELSMNIGIFNNSFIEFTSTDVFAAGTSLQSSNHEYSYNNLVEAFGEPSYEGIGDKTTTEFTVKWEKYDAEDGAETSGTFTIYDWHHARNLSDSNAKTKWNIGGFGFQDYVAFQEAMNIFNERPPELMTGRRIEIDTSSSNTEYFAEA
jgi:hypothetical protein